MTEYTVTWAVQIDADSHEDAARKARRMQLNPDSIADGPDWHTEEWGLHPDGQWRSTYNPHPGSEHWSASCPNCGY